MMYTLLGVGVMMAVTYLTRMLPIVLFRKPLRNRFLQSFLAYVPFAVLAAMTFPAILSISPNLISSIVGLLVAVLLAFFNRGLLVVALGATTSVLIVELILSSLT